MELTRRDLGALLTAVLAIVMVLATPVSDRLGGLSIDVQTALSWRLLGPRHEPMTSPAVVVAIDEETYTRPPFAGTPSVTWTGEIAKVLTAVLDGGATAVGFDIIFPTSIEESQIPFDGATLGAKVRGFDREYLRALARAARDGKVVLGQVQHRESPLLPSPAQRVAVGQGKNIRLLNFHTDPDDVVRRLPLSFATGAGAVPSMAVELAARHLGRSPELTVAGGLSLADWTVPTAGGGMVLRFEGGGSDIPTYALADLSECAAAQQAEYFKKEFAGKVVLLGTLLDLEDRKLTSKRFATGVEGAFAPRCGRNPPRATPVVRDTIAGVYVHATAVNNLVRREALTVPDRWAAAGLAAGIATLAGAAVLASGLLTGVAIVLVIAAAWCAACVLVFNTGLVLPLIEGLAGAGASAVSMLAWRFTVADRDKRLLRRSFGLYLAPALVERVVASRSPPELGGEVRNVTIFASDLAGFSSLSEQLPPRDLVTLMNAYLTEMTEIIGEHGGFVDKYIGDAIFAVFGAPIDDPDHAQRAVEAALACDLKLARMNAAAPPELFGRVLRHRIGLHTGTALVGNIGSRRRFNYTVMGDAANLASRLEGANKVYGTTILASAATVAAAGRSVLWREIDRARVVGREEPVDLFEPLAPAGSATPDQMRRASAYAAALQSFRRREFAAATAAVEPLLPIDQAARNLHAKASALLRDPPGSDWQPVTDLDSK